MSSRRRRRGRLTKLTHEDRKIRQQRNQRRGRPRFMFIEVNGARMRVAKLEAKIG